jgi:hypothetical protein
MMIELKEKTSNAELTMSDSAQILEEFCKVCAVVRNDFDLYRSLFENDPTGRDLCIATVPMFFEDINRLMVNNLFLQFCRITDPEGNGSRRNLTTNYILKCLPWPAHIQSALATANDRLMAFRNKIEKARSKRIAHIDFYAQVGQLDNMGKFDLGEDILFLRDLQEFINIAFGHLHNGATRSIVVGMSTDTYKLVRAIEKSILFDRCRKCSEAERANDILDLEQR